MRRKKIDDYSLQYINDLFGIKLIFYDPSRILQLSEFARSLRSAVLVVFNNFLLIGATDSSKITCNHYRIFFDVSLSLSYFAKTPLKHLNLILSGMKKALQL